MFGLDGILAAFLTFFQDLFMNEIFSFITGLIGGVLPQVG